MAEISLEDFYVYRAPTCTQWGNGGDRERECLATASHGGVWVAAPRQPCGTESEPASPSLVADQCGNGRVTTDQLVAALPNLFSGRGD